jgi:hypothetical protein
MVDSKWDRIREQVRGLHDDLHTIQVEVIEYEKSYTPGDGVDTTGSTVVAEISLQFFEEPDSVRRRYGTDTEADAYAYAKQNPSIPFTDYGAESELAAELEHPDGRHFRIQTADKQENGLVRLQLVEV